jgi:hypothetical protein
MRTQYRPKLRNAQYGSGQYLPRAQKTFDLKTDLFKRQVNRE